MTSYMWDKHRWLVIREKYFFENAFSKVIISSFHHKVSWILHIFFSRNKSCSGRCLDHQFALVQQTTKISDSKAVQLSSFSISHLENFFCHPPPYQSKGLLLISPNLHWLPNLCEFKTYVVFPVHQHCRPLRNQWRFRSVSFQCRIQCSWG